MGLHVADELARVTVSIRFVGYPRSLTDLSPAQLNELVAHSASLLCSHKRIQHGTDTDKSSSAIF